MLSWTEDKRMSEEEYSWDVSFFISFCGIVRKDQCQRKEK